MAQACLNSTMNLHVHKERRDKLCFKQIARTFINNEHRQYCSVFFEHLINF